MAGLLLIFWAASCSTAPVPGADSAGTPAESVKARIKPMVEALYLKTRHLETAYLDLRSVANSHAFMPGDLQLSHIQKSALYIQLTLQSAFDQQEFLSIMDDIKPGAMQDFYTLRHKALRKARDETGYNISFLKIYEAFITSADARKYIHSALEDMEQISKIYNQLMEAIAPLVRKGRTTAI